MKKKILSIVLALGLLTSMTAFADEGVTLINTTAAQETEIELKADYIELNAKISKISEYLELEGENVLAHAAITENTLVFANNGELKSAEDLKEGDTVSVFYRSNSKIPKIAPLTVDAAVVVVYDEKNPSSATVDTFSTSEVFGFVTNKANTLALNIDDENTEIVDANGEKAEKKAIVDKELVVFYTQVAMSLPGQTTPEKIVILPEVEKEVVLTDVSKITVNGEDIDTAPFVENDKLMLPVRKIAEQLGFDVKWDSTLNAVTVGTVAMGVNFNVGTDSYNKAKMTPFTLGAAPVQKIDGDYAVTYVPAEFFSELLELDVNVDGDTVAVNNAE